MFYETARVLLPVQAQVAVLPAVQVAVHGGTRVIHYKYMPVHDTYVYKYMRRRMDRALDLIHAADVPVHDTYMYKYMRRRMDRALDLIHAADGPVYDKK